MDNDKYIDIFFFTFKRYQFISSSETNGSRQREFSTINIYLKILVSLYLFLLYDITC